VAAATHGSGAAWDLALWKFPILALGIDRTDVAFAWTSSRTLQSSWARHCWLVSILVFLCWAVYTESILHLSGTVNS